MFCEQEQPGSGGHQRLVETERQTSASGQLRIDTLGDELACGLVWHGLVACIDVSMRAKLSPFLLS